MKNKKYYKNDFYALLCIFPITIIAKFVQYYFLSDLTSIDSNYILRLMSNNIEKEGTAFYVTAEFFKRINIFNLTTLSQWAVILAAIFSIILFVILLKHKKYSIQELIFIYASTILLNLYTFNLSKDIIQFMIFLLVYLIIFNEKLKNKYKIFLTSIVFLLEALFFRAYYIIIDYGFLLSMFVLRTYFVRAEKKELEKQKLIKITVAALLLFLVPIGLAKTIFPLQYDKLVNVRDEVTAVLTANTEINNLIEGNNFFVFTINYVINAIRILFPIELMLKGVKYLPFVLYQLYVTYYVLIKQLKKLKKENIISLSIIIGYFLGTIIFEPDFGSVIRHEITLILFFVHLNHARLESECEKQ